jgi:hypothetical protein
MSLPLPLKFPRAISVTAEMQIEAAACNMNDPMMKHGPRYQRSPE